jgi:hypothetical protein
MASKIAKALLSRGFFPKEVPPIFSSQQFGNKTAHLRKKGLASSEQWTSCDPFNMPHAKIGRRIAAVVNPIPFFGLAECISANWKEISAIYDKSALSFSRPIFNGQGRAIGDSDFDGFREALITRASGYSYVLHADFSRFFPTIYTHAIEWAAHTKSKAKTNLKLPKKKRAFHWGERLDSYVRNMQDGQTQGLPIGPDTSYVVAEIVASAIDHNFHKEFGRTVVGARLIDDYAVFFETRSDAEAAHSALTKAASEFQIALNNDKTYIEEITGPSRESWTYQLQWGDEVKSWQQQRRALLRYVDRAALLFQQNKNPAIGRYAVRVLSGQLIHQRNIDLAIACVLRMAQISPGSIPAVAKFVSGYREVGYKFNREPIATFVKSTLSRALSLGFDQEASWCIWMAIELGIKIPKEITAKVSYSGSSVVVLLAKYAEKKKLCSGIGQGIFGKKLVADDFRSSNWLLAYEAAMRSWFGWKRQDINGSLLEPLAKAGIHFMDLTAATPSAVKIKPQRDIRKFELLNLEDLEFEDLDAFLEAEADVDVYGSTMGDEDEDEDEGDEEVDEVEDDDEEDDEEGDEDLFEALGY